MSSRWSFIVARILRKTSAKQRTWVKTCRKSGLYRRKCTDDLCIINYLYLGHIEGISWHTTHWQTTVS